MQVTLSPIFRRSPLINKNILQNNKTFGAIGSEVTSKLTYIAAAILGAMGLDCPMA